MRYFNEYCAATEELCNFEDKIYKMVEDFVKDIDPLEARAVASFLISGITGAISEKTLRFAMEKRKAEKINNKKG